MNNLTNRIEGSTLTEEQTASLCRKDNGCGYTMDYGTIKTGGFTGKDKDYQCQKTIFGISWFQKQGQGKGT